LRQKRWKITAAQSDHLTDTHTTRVASATTTIVSQLSALAQQCHIMPHTELHGDVVRWGSDHILPSEAACCNACQALNRTCTVWVFCGKPSSHSHCQTSSLQHSPPSVSVACSGYPECGKQRGECWLKRLADPFTDLDLVRGQSDRWIAGTLLPPPPASRPGSRSAPKAEEAHLALVTPFGKIRLKLRRKSPLAFQWVSNLLAQHRECDGCTFYRAEPVPKHWGSPDWPDHYHGGRWGPPYALLQGGLSARGAPPPKAPREDNPVVRRGMAAWAGGACGPAFFIALADHPEWGRGHTVFADVVEGDMDVVERIVAQPARTGTGDIPITNLITPVRFLLEKLL
jgi:hypothetical protein